LKKKALDKNTSTAKLAYSAHFV